MKGDVGTPQPRLSSLIAHFVGRVCFGSIGFVALAIPAVLFSLAAHYLEEIRVSALVIETFLGIHYLLLVIDTVMFAVYIFVTVYQAAKELTQYVKGL